VTALLEAKELTSLGSLNVDFTETEEGTEEKGKKCNTAGDGTGVVLINGEAHLVFDLFTPKLELAALVLFPLLIIECNAGALIVEVEDPSMGRVVPISESGAQGDSTQAETRFFCPAEEHKQEISSYFNDNGTLLTKQLLKVSVSGGAQVEGCELTPTVLLKVETSSTAKMFTVLY